MADLAFVCPNCEDETLEMVERCLLGSTLAAVEEDGHIEIINSGEVWDGEIERFQCAGCGWVVFNDDGTVVESVVELHEIAKERGWLDE